MHGDVILFCAIKEGLNDKWMLDYKHREYLVQSMYITMWGKSVPGREARDCSQGLTVAEAEKEGRKKLGDETR